MSETFFGLFSGWISLSTCERIDKALKAAGLDAFIVRYQDPASGWRGWLSGPNRGAPFDAQLARDAIEVLTREGLWQDGAPVPRRVRGKLIRRETR